MEEPVRFGTAMRAGTFPLLASVFFTKNIDSHVGWPRPAPKGNRRPHGLVDMKSRSCKYIRIYITPLPVE